MKLQWKLEYENNQFAVYNQNVRVADKIFKYDPLILIPLSSHFTLYIGKKCTNAGDTFYYLSGVVYIRSRDEWITNATMTLKEATNDMIYELVGSTNKNRCMGIGYLFRKLNNFGFCELGLTSTLRGTS